MPLFTGTRTLVIRENVVVSAESYDKARELIEDDDPSVKILSENESGYELSGRLIENKEEN